MPILRFVGSSLATKKEESIYRDGKMSVPVGKCINADEAAMKKLMKNYPKEWEIVKEPTIVASDIVGEIYDEPDAEKALKSPKNKLAKPGKNK